MSAGCGGWGVAVTLMTSPGVPRQAIAWRGHREMALVLGRSKCASTAPSSQSTLESGSARSTKTPFTLTFTLTRARGKWANLDETT